MKGIRHRADVGHLGGPGFLGTLALHGAVVATFVALGGLHPPRRLPPVYRVNLIAPLGEPAPAAPAASPAASRPQPPAPRPAPPRAREARPVPKAEAPAPRPATRAPAPVAPAPQPARAANPQPLTPNPSSAAPTQPGSPSGQAGGTDVATIKTEGVEFPFPGYLNNLVSQVYRRWQPPPTSALLEAEIFFFVHRDGSVTGLQFIKRSGSFSFDLEAEGAIEAAARAGAFGPLPEGFGPDILPVSFYFNPRNVR